MSADWHWVRREEVIEIHEIQLAAHGGMSGIRDEGLLDSALARPINLEAYGGVDDIFALAGSYGFGIARNHPFMDGNKRTAFVVSIFFLSLQNMEFDAVEENVIDTVLSLAAGTLSEDKFAEWLRGNTAPNR